MPNAKVVGLRMDAMALALMDSDVLEQELGIKKDQILLVVGVGDARARAFPGRHPVSLTPPHLEPPAPVEPCH